jgi:hypothetical protein
MTIRLSRFEMEALNRSQSVTGCNSPGQCPASTRALISGWLSRNLREGGDWVVTMAAKQNITVAIEAALLKQARAIAARRGLSVSALLADELRELIGEDRAYEAARQSAKAMLKAGFDLHGARMRDRSEAHDRRRVR